MAWRPGAELPALPDTLKGAQGFGWSQGPLNLRLFIWETLGPSYFPACGQAK